MVGSVVGSGFGQQHILFLFFFLLPQENLSEQASVPAGQGFLLLMHLAPSCFIQELPVKIINDWWMIYVLFSKVLLEGRGEKWIGNSSV